MSNGSNIREAVGNARRDRNNRQGTPSTFVTGDTKAGEVKQNETPPADPPEEKTQDD